MTEHDYDNCVDKMKEAIDYTYEEKKNKVSSWSSTVSDANYPSEKLVKDTIDDKQDVLVSGTNLKTINSQSLLGNGDLIVGNDAGTFTDLQNAINQSGVTKLVLDKDYKYNATTDSSLTNGIVIDKTITIIGNGHIIDGNNSTRAFYMYDQSGKTLTLEDLRIQNCSTSSNGGAIYIYNSQININNTNLTQNNATSSGGAIYTSTSQINITHTNINNNNATYSGGAIFASNSQINITHTNLTQNKANTGDGGAILVANSSQLTMKESVIKNNTASHYANIYCMTATTVYDCDINDISTSCYNVSNITTESLYDLIGDAIAYINM